MNYVDYTGMRFGKLVVLKRGVRNEKRGLYEWVCQCDCGNIKSIIGRDMKRGNTISCGCMSSRNFAGERTKTHGLSNTKIYNVWRTMKSRCKLPSNKSYKDYGARGIKVCDEWNNSFELFYKWAIANGYSEELTIDRIDVDGNYEPSNCRWATRKQQNNNKRNTTKYTVLGFTGNKSELCEHFNVTRSALYHRLKRGIELEQALTLN